jgi:hypothetical protein
VSDWKWVWWVGVPVAVAAIFFLVWVQETDSATARSVEVIAVTGRVESAAPPAGRGGNYEWLRWSIRDRHGRTIGMGLLACQWQLRQARLCVGELRFFGNERVPPGKLSVGGTSETRSLGEWSVNGGTGRFQGANGSMTFRATGLRRLTLNITI